MPGSTASGSRVNPPAFNIHNIHGKASVLLVADHASRYIPPELNQLGVSDADMDKHIAWDIGSADLARTLADLLDAPLILSAYSRLLIDPNRQPGDPTAMPEISDGVVIPGNQVLDEEQRNWRIENFFKPYHAAINERLDAFERAGVIPALLSIHTCTPVFGNMERPWQIGVMWDKDPRIAAPVLEYLNRLEDLCIGDNQPYSGKHPHDYTIDVHAEGRGLAHVGIEVRQDLLPDLAAARRWAEVLAGAFKAPLAEQSTYCRLAEWQALAALSS